MKVSVVIPTIRLENVGKVVEYWKDADEIIIAYNLKQQVVDNMNDGAKKATGDIIVFANDRVVMRPDWRKIVEGKTRGILSFAPIYVTNGAISREYLEKYQAGFILHPEYIHHYADLELREKAQSVGLYDEVSDMLFCHPKKPTVVDEKRVLKEVRWDLKTYWRRKKAGFPNEITGDMEKRKRAIYIH